jgi:two-component system invasion response regulator UvrY
MDRINRRDGNLRLLLVDDHAVVRQGYLRLLESAHDIEVVGEAQDGAQAYRLFCELEPDLTVLDISLPGASGIEITRRIVARAPEARVLVFTMHEEPVFASRALQAGARGYLCKSCPPQMFVDAIRSVGGGAFFIDPRMAQRLAFDSIRPDPAAQLPLSEKEFEVFRLLAGGRTTAEIAAVLNLTSKTVSNYQSAIKQKLNVDNSAQLVHLAFARGILGAAPGTFAAEADHIRASD